MSGCEDETIQRYQTPKAAEYIAPSLMPTAGATDIVPATASWDKPDAWEDSPEPSSMAEADYVVADEAGPARVSVTRLTGEGGGVLANINRWRGQVGLPPIQVIEEQPMTPVRSDHFLAGLMDLSAPQGEEAMFERMLIVLIPRREENQTWFIKMTGPKLSVDSHRDEFVGFVESIRFDEDSP